ncbi:MAG TPA: polysaccharide deacetylase family protein [Microthrixaceae bacterium]|nr:polysaccharide deacetylase family protein [Microthrixaceae bacterium]
MGLPIGGFRTIFSARTDANVLSLTFDDGPDPEFTEHVLTVLDRYDVGATFCMMGHNALEHRSLAQSVVSHGHEVANHSLTHLDQTRLSPRELHDEIALGHQAVVEATGSPVRYFRPPRGRLVGRASRVLAELNSDALLWSISGSLRAPTTTAKLTKLVIDALHPGAIVCFHDGIGRGTFAREQRFARELKARRNAEIEALPAIIEAVIDRGYSFATVTELLGFEATNPYESEITSLDEPQIVDGEDSVIDWDDGSDDVDSPLNAADPEPVAAEETALESGVG